MALALNNLKRVDMPLKTKKPKQTIKAMIVYKGIIISYLKYNYLQIIDIR